MTRYSDGAGKRVAYDYDLIGQPTRITYPADASHVVVRGYDDAGQLSSVTDWLGQTSTFGYDPNGNLTRQSYANGAQASRAYDRADRLERISESSPRGPLLDLTYTRDNVGLTTSENARSFTYDALDRIKTQSSPAIAYDYDAAPGRGARR